MQKDKDPLMEFCDSWFSKARRYSGRSLKSVFDQYFTLFVVYNKIYSHIAIQLAREGKIELDQDSFPPDKKSATKFLLLYIPPEELLRDLLADHETKNAFHVLCEIMHRHEFNIILKGVSGEAQRERDANLSHDLESNDSSHIVLAVLTILYHVRCNLFHGHKGFQTVQLKLMVPLVAILRRITVLFYQQIKQRGAA